jgi:outer membrane protein TolC
MILLLIIYPLVHSFQSQGQDIHRLTLEEAQQKAQKNYPLSRQRPILKETENLLLQNLDKNYFPQLVFNGQATNQSDVTKVNVPLPGFKIDPPDVNQYKLYTDLSQVIYDGGTTRQQKKLQQLNTIVEEQKLDVELYRLRERVNQLFLSVILLQEQERAIGILKKDILSVIDKTAAQVQNGVALRSHLDVLMAESLKTDQRLVELQSAREGLVKALAILQGEQIENSTLFVHPASPPVPGEINRPELGLFRQQSLLVNQQKEFIKTKKLPKLYLFGQAGYARPGLNLLKNEATFYYIGGIRINWNMNSLYTYKNEKRLADLNNDLVNIQKETFLLNTQTQLTQQQAEMQKLEKLIQSDREIIGLRERIVTSAKAQLDNNVITSHDFIREVNAADQARQALILHELQLLQARINYQTTAGN